MHDPQLDQILEQFGFDDPEIEDTVIGLTAVIDRAERRAVSDLWEWGQTYVSHFLTKPPSKMHEWLAKKLAKLHRKRGQRQSVVAPRGSAKSTWISCIYILWCAVEGIEPYIFLISDTTSQARIFLKTLKDELEGNELLARDYPLATGVGPMWRTDSIQLQNGVVIEALGTGSRIRGRRRGANRPSLIVLDDPENDEHISSVHMRQKSWDWFTKALIPAGNKKTNVIVLGTALHRECLVFRTKITPRWRFKMFKSIIKGPTNEKLWKEWEELYVRVDDLHATDEADQFYADNKKEMDDGSKVLWPDEEDLYTLMCMRLELGKSAFETEKQNNPINQEVCEWPEEYFGDHIWFDKWPHFTEFTQTVISLDPSKGKDSRRGDYSAFVKFGRDKEGVMYVEADLNRSRDIKQIVNDGIGNYRMFPASAFVIETNQFQEMLMEEFFSFARAEGLEIPVYGMFNTVKKEQRIRTLGPYLSRRQFRFKANSPATKILVDQMQDFPVGDHDDGPDALEMAVRMAVMLQTGNMDLTRTPVQWS